MVELFLRRQKISSVECLPFEQISEELVNESVTPNALKSPYRYKLGQYRQIKDLVQFMLSYKSEMEFETKSNFMNV